MTAESRRSKAFREEERSTCGEPHFRQNGIMWIISDECRKTFSIKLKMILTLAAPIKAPTVRVGCLTALNHAS
jgi:hypothetical protein